MFRADGAAQGQSERDDAIGAVLLALTTLLVVVVLGRTVMAATRGDLLRPE